MQADLARRQGTEEGRADDRGERTLEEAVVSPEESAEG
jgi:hypothetical protein